MNTMSGKQNTVRPNFVARIWRFYYEGFRQMTVGKTLWAIILLKLFVFFVILKTFFFPNLLKRDFNSDSERAAHVRHELTDRSRNKSTEKAGPYSERLPLQTDGKEE